MNDILAITGIEIIAIGIGSASQSIVSGATVIIISATDTVDNRGTIVITRIDISTQDIVAASAIKVIRASTTVQSVIAPFAKYKDAGGMTERQYIGTIASLYHG